MAGNLSIIDQFTNTFSTYIDSGFGLIGHEVGFLVTILIGIDVALAALFWVMNRDDEILFRFARKILFVGFFAYLLNDFDHIAGMVFKSFAGIGLEAAGSNLSYAQFLQPGQIAQAGVNAAQPLLDQIAQITGFTAFFSHFVEIFALLLAWIVTVISFFVLAILVFLAIVEFKLAVLLGFVLVPFALWKGTSFIAEPVLGNVVTHGIRIMAFAVVVGIGTTLFGQLVPPAGQTLTVNDALAVLLGALTLAMLAFACPRIAAGLHSGAPQLGLGSVVAPAAIAGGAAFGMGAGALGIARAGVGGVHAAASLAGGTRTAYAVGSRSAGGEGMAGIAGGIGGVARAGVRAAASGPVAAGERAAMGLKESFAAGERAGWSASGGDALGGASSAAGSRTAPPAWARRFGGDPLLRNAGNIARSGDGSGGGLRPQLRKDEE